MTSDKTHDCDGCPLVPRRDFLRDAGLLAAGLLFAGAMPMEAITPVRESAEEKTYPIPAKDGAQIDKGNDTIVARYQGKVYVYSLACPHQNTAIKWFDKDNYFECPKHHSRYLPDGEYVKDSGRATRGLDRFAVRKDGANVVANLDKLYQEDDNEADWKVAFITI